MRSSAKAGILIPGGLPVLRFAPGVATIDGMTKRPRHIGFAVFEPRSLPKTASGAGTIVGYTQDMVYG
jgi:hypothetical protein